MNISISRDALVRRSTLVTGIVVAVALLGLFYSIVAGAVDRAAQHRATQLGEAAAPAYKPVARAAVGVPSNASYHGAAFSARNVSYVRSVR